MCKRDTTDHRILPGLVLAAAVLGPTVASAQVHDPGVRRAASDGGPPQAMPGLTTDELAFFQDGLARFVTVEVVSGAGQGQGNGLGPRFNSNQCSSCHQQPFVGGSSPASNPLIAVATAEGARNTIPWFIAPNGFATWKVRARPSAQTSCGFKPTISRPNAFTEPESAR